MLTPFRKGVSQTARRFPCAGNPAPRGFPVSYYRDFRLILIFNKNLSFATVFFTQYCVRRLENTYSIPCAVFLVLREKSSPLG